MFDILLLDLDDTILDFHMQEKVAIEKTLSGAGIPPTEENCALYSRINDGFWKRLEKGEVTRQQILYGRFEELFAQLGINRDSKETALAYMGNLAEGHYYLPGALEAVQSLCKHYRLFLVSNGTTCVQEKRLKSADLCKYFEGVFISQDIGVNKPNKGFFDYCFAHIADFDPQKALIVGDSLSSDILGGKNAGIATCWVNPNHKQADPERMPDYEIESITQLEVLLRTL